MKKILLLFICFTLLVSCGEKNEENNIDKKEKQTIIENTTEKNGIGGEELGGNFSSPILEKDTETTVEVAQQHVTSSTQLEEILLGGDPE